MNQPTILVSPPEYDNVNAVLQQLGGDFANTRQLQDNELHLLQNPHFLSQFQHLFLNCHSNFRTGIAPQTIAAIRDFVENGGTLYASDWASEVIEAAFGSRAAFAKNNGKAGMVKAEVSDPFLARTLGSKITIHFDMDMWDLIRKFPAWTDVYLRDEHKQPLTVGFRVGRGLIVFSSFHHHAQQSSQIFSHVEERLLQWLVTISTQHGHMMLVRNTLARYGAAHISAPVVSRIGAQPQTRSLKLGSKAGLGVFALSWEQNDNLEFLMSYLRGGEVVQAEEKSSLPPLVMTVRNPRDEDAVEIRRVSLAKLLDKDEEMHPYVFGAGLRRGLLGDPDWFALAIMRHIQQALVEQDTLRAARSLINSDYIFKVLDTILTGLGYAVERRSRESQKSNWSCIVAKSGRGEDSAPGFQIETRIIDLPASLEAVENRIDDLASEPFATQGAINEGTERLFVCIVFSKGDTIEGPDPDSIVDMVKSSLRLHGWQIAASESSALSLGQEVIFAEEYSATHYLNVLVYRLENNSSHIHAQL